MLIIIIYFYDGLIFLLREFMSVVAACIDVNGRSAGK